MEYSNLYVCLLGIGTVFVGLVCIIILCKIMGILCKMMNIMNKGTNNEEEIDNSTQLTPISTSNTAQIPNRQEMIAAISAVIAEELGKDISAIKILSVKKL